MHFGFRGSALCKSRLVSNVTFGMFIHPWTWAAQISQIPGLLLCQTFVERVFITWASAYLGPIYALNSIDQLHVFPGPSYLNAQMYPLSFAFCYPHLQVPSDFCYLFFANNFPYIAMIVLTERVLTLFDMTIYCVIQPKRCLNAGIAGTLFLLFQNCRIVMESRPGRFCLFPPPSSLPLCIG